MNTTRRGVPVEERRILECSLPPFNMTVYLHADEEVISRDLQPGDVLLIDRLTAPLPGESVIVRGTWGEIHHLDYDDYKTFSMRGRSYFGVLVGYFRPAAVLSR